MDVNGHRFWAISGAAGWPLSAQASHDLAICRDTGALRLIGKSDVPAVTENKAAATRIVDSPARVKDALDTIAFWDDVALAIMTVRDGGSPAPRGTRAGRVRLGERAAREHTWSTGAG